MLNAARTGVVEERMGRAFSRKEHLELNREGEEVSQVKKGDHKEEKAVADETGKTVRAFICHIREPGLYSISNSFKL